MVRVWSFLSFSEKINEKQWKATEIKEIQRVLKSGVLTDGFYQNLTENIIKKRLKWNYFSFICKIPIKVNNDNAIIGAQTAKIRGILSVWPRARDKSLK